MLDILSEKPCFFHGKVLFLMQIEAHCAMSNASAKARRSWMRKRRTVPKAGAAAVLLCWVGKLIAAGLSHLQMRRAIASI